MRNDFEEMDKMQDVLREAQTGLWTIELDAGKEPRMFADSAMLWLLGFTEKPSPEACYRGWYDRIVDAYYPAVQEAVEKIVQDVRTEVEYPWIHPKWGQIHVRCGGVRDWSYKNGICLRGYHQNITHIVMSRQEAQRRERIFSSLCQCYYSIYLFDLEKDLQEAIWQEDFIQEQNEFPKGSLSEYYEKFVREYVYHEDQERMKRAGTPQFLQQVLSSENSVYDVDYRRIYPDRLAWVRSRFSVAEIKDQKVVKVVFANMNINEQKLEEIEQEENTKNALIAAYESAKSANEAKSRFLAQVSHDIRTPMNAVIGMTAIASEHLNEPDKIADCLQKIDFSSKHLLTLINEILDMSKIEKGRIDLVENPFDLQELIREVQAIMAPQALGKKQDMVFKEINILHHKLVGDAGRIRQVLINLINNSVKYTPDGGKISVTIHEVFGHSSGYGSFVFVIEDNGIGMSSDFLKYIFIPFARADDLRIQGIQGTGLGMSIAHGIILAMQGDIRVESEEGRGSRFIVTLNLKLADAGNENLKDRECSRKINTPVSGQEKTGESKVYRAKVLVVEDNDLNMEITRTILEENGYYVDGAVNGKEAYERFISSASGVYQAILMDLQMPVMDGCTAAKMIRGSVHPQALSIPIIALTANAFAEDITNALASGMNEHISKPIDHQRLIGVLGNYIS